MSASRPWMPAPDLDEPVMFHDRADAGRRLAQRLLGYRGKHPVVLALPRGGVPVAFEVAQALDAPLDLILVRKIGTPWQPELAVGAVADGDKPCVAVNQPILSELDISEDFVRKEARRQLAEIERRRKLYLAGRAPLPLAGKTAIVVDDGIATGATVEAALASVKHRGARHVVLAVPVAPPDTLSRLEKQVDEIVCLSAPSFFGAISVFYERFPQLEDREVVDLLRRANPSAGEPTRTDQR